MSSSRTLTFRLDKLREATVERYDEAIALERDKVSPDAQAERQAQWRQAVERRLLDLARRLRSKTAIVEDGELDNLYLPPRPRISRWDANETPERVQRLEGKKSRALKLIDALAVDDREAVTLTATQAKEFLGVDL